MFELEYHLGAYLVLFIFWALVDWHEYGCPPNLDFAMPNWLGMRMLATATSLAMLEIVAWWLYFCMKG